MSIIKKLVASFVGLNPAGPRSAMKLLSVLLAFILGATLWVGPTAAAEKKYVTDPTTGKVVTAPEYGGTLRLGWNREPEGTDPSIAGGWAGFILNGVAQKLAAGDWAIDRDEFDYLTDFIPIPILKGQLAESWETPDALTIIVHIRQGVHWHDKPPMNGRELTADDIVYNFHRLTGTGDFSGPAGYYEHMTDLPWESITATDKWTVVFKLKEPVFGVLTSIIDHHMVYILPPEVIEEHGDVNDWRNVVGTGPYMFTEWVEGSSMSWDKNPDYWGYDEKYPQNRLPYIDEIRALVMPDEATRLAALRTAKVDYVGVGSQSPIMTIDAAESLKRTNPELQVESWWQRSNASFATNVTEPPFDDIRVRHAMQMALDLETIANTFFKGYARTTPMGIVGRKGYYVPFEEWSEDIKQYYRYDPEGAEKLLDEAGYPRGPDGIRFKTTQDLLYLKDYPEIAEEYWRQIGVHVTSYQQDAPTYDARFKDQSYGGMTWWMGFAPSPPMKVLSYSVSGAPGNRHGTSDPAFDAMYEAAEAATTEEEQIRLIREMDMYYIEQHWTIWGPITPMFGVVQPWVKGWSGETKLGAMGYSSDLFSRLWIDQDLKKEMGH